MAQSVYSWMGTSLHLILDDHYANTFNEAQAAWFKAQRDHKREHGRDWDPLTEPIRIQWSDAHKKAWDEMATLINLLIEMNGGNLAIGEKEITFKDYLVKIT